MLQTPDPENLTFLQVAVTKPGNGNCIDNTFMRNHLVLPFLKKHFEKLKKNFGI